MKSSKIYIFVGIAVLILGALSIYLAVSSSRQRTPDSEIAVSSDQDNSQVALYQKDSDYKFVSQAPAPATFKSLYPGDYMVAVSIEDSDVCPYALEITLGESDKQEVAAEIDTDNLCLE